MKVTLFGHEYEVTFNMAVMIEFEELSGVMFDLGDENHPGTIVTQKAMLQLCYASLKVANSKIPFSYEQLAGYEPFDLELGMSVGETAELKNNVKAEMYEWFGIPKVMLKDEKPQGDVDPKND